MQSIVGPFPEVEAAYRAERISASFRDHAASTHRHFFGWHRHTTGTNGTDGTDGTDGKVAPHRPLRAA